jgi:hypothetical protein
MQSNLQPNLQTNLKPIVFDKNIYRLIKPYQSTKVYEAKTTMHGAGKCYKELKQSNVHCDSFSIQNLADNSVYDFKLQNKPRLESLIIKSDSKQSGGIDANKELLERRLAIIEDKILHIEQKISVFETKYKL